MMERSIQFAKDLRGGGQTPTCQFHRALEPGLRFRGRALAMERVLVNLLVNGARAATEHGKPGEVHTEAFARKDQLWIVVSDSGPGIAPDILPLIFDAGFSTRSQSSGLGLHIVRSIVKDHGGTVSAANSEDRSGACFTICIPLSSGFPT